MNFFVTNEGSLTTAGYTAAAILLFLLLIGISMIGSRLHSAQKRRFSPKVLTFASAAIALAFVCSYISVFRMPLGGSVTLFSMLFVTLIGYWYGPSIGLTAGVAYGLLQMIQNPYIISVPQMMVDYIFAFGALGLSGFFSNRPHGLLKGYVAAVFGRFLFAVLSGVIFFGQYAPEGMNSLTYSVLYNGAYLGAEGALTLMLLFLPPVKQALLAIKNQALS